MAPPFVFDEEIKKPNSLQTEVFDLFEITNNKDELNNTKDMLR